SLDLTDPKCARCARMVGILKDVEHGNVRIPFSRHYVRSPGTPEEARWTTEIGGDFHDKGLLRAPDTDVFVDAIYCDLFDQPRCVLQVKPQIGSGTVVFWEAILLPRSDWLLLYGPSPAAKAPVGAPDMAGSADQIPLVKEGKAGLEGALASNLILRT